MPLVVVCGTGMSGAALAVVAMAGCISQVGCVVERDSFTPPPSLPPMTLKFNKQMYDPSWDYALIPKPQPFYRGVAKRSPRNRHEWA